VLDIPRLINLCKGFSAGADAEIVGFLNHYLTQPREAEPNLMEAFPFFIQQVHASKFKYISLLKYSEDDVLARYAFLCHFNAILSQTLSHFEIHDTPINYETPEDKIQLPILSKLRLLRTRILHKTKDKLWQKALDATQIKSEYLCVDINFYVANDLKAKVASGAKAPSYHKKFSVFCQVFNQMRQRQSKFFRLPPGERLMKIFSPGLGSDDAGGPYRDALEQMCSELESPTLELFELCANGVSKTGLNRDCYVPSKLGGEDSRGLKLEMYEFIGKLMGAAIRSKFVLNLHFAPLIWKKICCDEINPDQDLKDIDIYTAKYIEDLRKRRVKPSLLGASWEEEEDEDQKEDIANPQGVEDEAMSEEASEKVEEKDEDEAAKSSAKNARLEQNLAEFRAAHLSAYDEQCKALRCGLLTVVPSSLLSLFSWKELRRMVSGDQKIDVDFLERHTSYLNGNTRTDPHVEIFWEVLKTRFTQEDLAKFMTFVWGQSRLPARSEDLTKPFKICNHKVNAHERPSLIDQALPVAHTCFFSIDLPRYSSVDICHERLLYAVTNCVAIDIDTDRIAGLNGLQLTIPT